MNQLVDPPAVRANPARAVEEERMSDSQVCGGGREHRGKQRKQQQGQAQVAPVEVRVGHAQKDLRVSTSSCTAAMSLARSSGMARSMWSTLPSPERALP